ncbi:MAG TPA: sugar ABC transporter permease [Myxococcota bacterium]|nr:sugar ABC transporter permease [Myxococcota bacterium]HNZ02997.1 sugar ABC transporter permease [Myxococcota bacterium]HOD06819.1 sugar ABC transporter permease [Myxococcota bacterium]HPB50498.1 sugar ABC transporter permease [Myxococcota bacterium]HQP95534.1 sugar ABC transporter permease [Myxococcota bacterium]
MNRRPTWLVAIGWNLALVAVCAVTLYPVLWVLKMALTPSQAFDMSPIPFPSTFSLSNFQDLVTSTDMAGNWLFGHWLFNSVVVAVATTLLSLALATTAAYAFSRFVFPGRRLGMTLFLVTQMFPGVVMAIPLYLLLDAMNLLDSMVGLTLVYATTAIPFCVWMMKGYFDTIPKDLEEAAVMDGAGRWTMFFRIILPLARPALVVTALFSFMTAWNEFILAATFLGDETSFTLPVALQRYVGDYSTEWGHFAAGAILVSAPVMALFFALQRHLIGGLTAGGVKG